ncbi:MAG: ribosome biogenesis GTPase YlqF [Candidatus Muiribacterium halophilum]|uniref:Ribosome biogenesis GTPase A n=1 Tax=Muiribacterium halophilum TaxID=2053465 RepID=A0A2N5ZMV0_MUIH1|nr:MAG: ribosome biogenesis GTPase YlqF [Candidatus Muirbacterium halophilum]
MDGNSLKWYPGHIAKARRKIREQLSKINILVEVLDARAPISSDSGIFNKIQGKQIIYVVNKCDLIEDSYLKEIKKHFSGNKDVIFLSAKRSKNMKEILNRIKTYSKGKTSNLSKFGFKNTIVHVMIAGMPNVGKTEIIKKISGRKKLQVANRPGVTRNQQWISFENIRIMDTPGVLYPDFEDDDVVKKLAFLNIVDPARIGYEIVFEFIYNNLSQLERNIICENYRILETDIEFEIFLEKISEKTGIKGNENIASRVFSDYNKGCFKQIVMDRLNEDKS